MLVLTKSREIDVDRDVNGSLCFFELPFFIPFTIMGELNPRLFQNSSTSDNCFFRHFCPVNLFQLARDFNPYVYYSLMVVVFILLVQAIQLADRCL